MDGSQPTKIGFEKELVYGKVVIRGKAVELLLKCVNIFGGTAEVRSTEVIRVTF